jgi:uncharacterized protein (DUF952 family)
VRIYKLMARADWEAFRAVGTFEGSADDRRDGFIHFSTAEQTPETARRHFADVADLVALEVETDRLGAALKWEPSRGGALFPHLYGVLDVRDVVDVADLPKPSLNTGAGGP